MNNSQPPTCIYCAGTGPFNSEHVFPAGMGGDDKNFLLVDLVCQSCNTGIFSKLELALMRRSPTALGRKFNQKKSRPRGSQSAAPGIETKSFYILDTTGRMLEADNDETGAEVILSQYIIEDPKIYSTARDCNSLEKLHTTLSNLINLPSISLIKKIKGAPVSFEISTYKWGDDSYSLSEEIIATKPPKLGLWLDVIDDAKVSITPRFFQRLAGQLVLKTDMQADHAALLRGIRRTLPTLKDSIQNAAANSIETPIFQAEMPMDLDGTERALAKIGVNFLAHTLGKNYVSHQAFDEIKSSILTGDPKLPISSIGKEHQETIDAFFGIPPDDCHCILLSPAPSQINNGHYDIFFNAKLYTVDAHRVVLAKELPATHFFEPVYFLVNYNTNDIKKLPLVEYQLKHGVMIEQILKEAGLTFDTVRFTR